MTLIEVVTHHNIKIPMILQFMDASKQYIDSKFELSQFDALYDLLIDAQKTSGPVTYSLNGHGENLQDDMVSETERFLKIIQYELFVFCKN
jgi:hypothetical protein